MTYSFDIFDTCLVRTCGNPAFVFEMVARRVLPSSEETQWFDFTLERKRGEAKARKLVEQTGGEEVTLEEIYSCCNFTGLDFVPSNEVLMEEELSVERMVLTPVASMRNKINQLRKGGNRIVFISDMYLPYDFIKEVMVRHGFLTDSDYLFVSSRTNKTKHSGCLFKWVHDELNLDYPKWIHAGDNRWSDVEVPRRLGIKATCVTHDFSYYEGRLKSKGYSSRTQVSYMLASISKAVRLGEEDDAQVKFAADLIAPVFVPFVFSVLQDAQRRGIENLYFLARDAYVFYVIAKKLEDLFPLVTAHYLYVSRNSLYLPGLDDVSLESLMPLFTNIDWQGVDDVLSRLHLSSMKGEFASLKGKRLYGAEKILPLLLENEKFTTALERKRKEQRELAVEYFRSEGLGVGKTAVVDLTGTRRCHHAINKILRSAGLHDAFGYYFEVLDKRSVGGGYKALNFFERYGYTDRRYAIGPHDLFEQYFCITPHKRTYEYMSISGGARPVYEEDCQNESYKERVSQINIRVSERFAEYYKVLLPMIDHEYGSELAVAVTTEFLQYPKKEYLEAIKDCEMSDSSVQHYTLLSGKSVFSILKNRSRSPWLYGNIVYSSHFSEFWRMLLKWKSRKG